MREAAAQLTPREREMMRAAFDDLDLDDEDSFEAGETGDGP